MLFVGNQRSGPRDLAQRLMKEENERVEIFELRGFASRDLDGAFRESQAISRATRCKQHLFSLSINPPPIEDASNEDFVDAIDRAEKTLGLSGQPRAIVFHEKVGRDGQLRRHAHAVWCRIDPETMTARHLSFSKSKLQKLSRELYLEHDWRMPPGMLHQPDRDPRNFTLAQWQQAKRANKDPEKIIGVFQDCWSVSDSKTSFGHALAEHGYELAQGRRGFVAVDHEGEVFAVSKWTKRKARDVREKLGDHQHLPDVATAHARAAQRVTDRLNELKEEQKRAESERLERLDLERKRQEATARKARQRQLEEQRERRRQEATERQARLRKGIMGLVDRITGKWRKTQKENTLEQAKAYQRDRQERTAQRERQQANEASLFEKQASLKSHYMALQKELSRDVERLVPSPSDDQLSALQKRLSQNRQRRRRPSRTRDGPSYDR